MKRVKSGNLNLEEASRKFTKDFEDCSKMFSWDGAVLRVEYLLLWVDL